MPQSRHNKRTTFFPGLGPGFVPADSDTYMWQTLHLSFCNDGVGNKSISGIPKGMSICFSHKYPKTSLRKANI